MAIAFLVAKRRKDRNTQVGACIVNEDRRIVGTGYNGMPNGCSDGDGLWSTTGQSEPDNEDLCGKKSGKFT